METKTFGELIINDSFYVFCKNNGNYFNLIAGKLEMSEDKRNHIAVRDDNGEITDLPCDESRYEDADFIYTTNKLEFNKWHIPHWEKQIVEKEVRISSLKWEVEELQGEIDKANVFVLAAAPK